MKFNTNLLAATAFVAVASLLSSCDLPTFPSDVADSKIATKTFTSYDAVTVPAVDATLSNDFMRGFDASMISAIEDTGELFYDEDNSQKDPLAILKQHGVNWIRLRLWNNPEVDATAIPAGDNNLIRTVAIAKRAKSLGLNVLLDIHYSDSWADPTNQKCPSAWSSISTATEMATKIYDYTYDVLDALNTASATPDMIQIGNEIDKGLLVTGCGATAVQGDIDSHADNLALYLNNASTAVRLACPKAKVMIHLSRGGYNGLYTAWFGKSVTVDGNATTMAEGVDFDVIGLSYYPTESSHKTLVDLKSNIASLIATYAKEVVVAETSYGWTLSYGDNTSNLFYTDDEEQAYTNLVTTDETSANYNADDFVLSKDDDGNNVIAGTPQNQANVIRSIIEATAASGGEGVFYWGGDWIPATNIADNYENQALFDFSGKCLPSMNVFSVTMR